jgi:RNA polymerase sigma-70 factor (ECF subfamily)
MRPVATQLLAEPDAVLREDPSLTAGMRFAEAYRTSFAFVYRCVRRLGVPAASVDDVVQDVFVVVHRRWADFDHRSSLRGWVYGILARVVLEHRRSTRRRARVLSTADVAALPSPHSPESAGPERCFAQRQALTQLGRLLEALDEQKREVLVLSELEQMSAPEIAQALGANLNTIYSRLASARKQFSELYAEDQRRAHAKESA